MRELWGMEAASYLPACSPLAWLPARPLKAVPSLTITRPPASVTHLGYAEAAVRVRGAANLQRLAAVKARVDPTGVFAATPLAPVLAAADAEQ